MEKIKRQQEHAQKRYGAFKKAPIRTFPMENPHTFSMKAQGERECTILESNKIQDAIEV